MNRKDLLELTNAQLKEECEDLGLDKVVGSNNPHKPTKDDYINAIMAKISYEPVDVEEVEEIVTVDAPSEPTSTRKPQSAAKLSRLELFRKDRVIVHDTQEGQSKNKDEMISISWGNRLIGGQTDFVSLNGQPQYIRRGAIRNLIDATTVSHEPKANGNGVTSNVTKRFVISEVGGLTPKELEELANRQKMRNAKYA